MYTIAVFFLLSIEFESCLYRLRKHPDVSVRVLERSTKMKVDVHVGYAIQNM